jgi:Tol biopolymer transport system component
VTFVHIGDSVGKTQWWVGSGRTAFCLGAIVSFLVVLVMAAAARADEIAYSCGYDICTIDPDNHANHADLTETNAAEEYEPVWSPDGSQIAFTGSYETFGRVYTLPVPDPTQEVFPVSSVHGIIGGEAAWSPDGTKIAFAGASEAALNDTNVYVSPVDGSAAPQVIGHTAEEEHEPAWSPDGGLLAFAHLTTTWLSAPVESATASLLPNGLGAEPAWSPNGTRIATVTAGEPHKVRLVPVNGLTPALEMPVAAENSSDVSWSPDGTHIVYVDANDQVRIAQTEPPGEGFEITLPHEVGVPLDVSFSPEGNRVAFGAEELQPGGVQNIYVASASGGEAVKVTETVNSREPSWKPIPGAGGGPGGSPGSGNGESPGGSSGGAGSSGGSGSGTSGSGSSGGGTGGAKPRSLSLASFRKPALNPEFLGAAYIDCDLGSTNAACHANGEATYYSPITHSLTYAKSKAKPIVFAKGSITVPNGKTEPLPLKLTAAGKKLMKGRKSLKLTETVVETAPGAKPKTTTKTFTVAVPKKK